MKKLIIPVIAAFILVSCGGDKKEVPAKVDAKIEQTKEEGEESVETVTEKVEATVEKVEEKAIDAESNISKSTEDKPKLEGLSKDVSKTVATNKSKTVSTQPKSLKGELKPLSKATFCSCVKQQKKLEDELMKTEDAAEEKRLMAEIDALGKGECKNLMASDLTSPEARAAHKKKVDDCLK